MHERLDSEVVAPAPKGSSETVTSDNQHQHFITQETISAGDSFQDDYVRHTRPLIARQSWYVSALYVLVMSVLAAFGKGTGPSIEVAMLLMSAAWAYLGLRTADGFARHPKGSGEKLTSALSRALGVGSSKGAL